MKTPKAPKQSNKKEPDKKPKGGSKALPSKVTTAAKISKVLRSRPVPKRDWTGPLVGFSRGQGKLTRAQEAAWGMSGILAFIGIWCWLTYGGHIKPLFLPTPRGVFLGLKDLYAKQWLVHAIVASFWRVAQSLFLVGVIGIPIGILMGAVPPIDAFLHRLISGAKSVPTTGIAGLIVIWFGIEERAKVVFLLLGSVFYMIILVRGAVHAVSPDLVRVALDIGASRAQVIRKVLLPAALPRIWEAIAVCNGIMWTYIVLAEYINSGIDENLGLGVLINIASKTMESGQVYGVLLIVAVISTASDQILHVIRRRYFNW